MKNAFKKIVLAIIFYTGIHHLFRLLYINKFNKSGLILYTHRIVDPSEKNFYFLKGLDYMTSVEFERKIKYIKRYYTFITLSDYVTKKKAGDDLRRFAVLTFDDGYRSVYDSAFPILRKHKIPFTVFITTGLVNGDLIYWYDRLLTVIIKSQRDSINLPKLGSEAFRFDSLKEKQASLQRIALILKHMPDSQKETALAMIIAYSGIQDGAANYQYLYLTWDQILEMRNSGLATIGSHTVAHPLLTKVDFDRAVKEIEESAKTIEKELGEKTKFFSYPNGDYNSILQSIIKDAGYSAAFTVNIYSDTGGDILAIPRIGFDRERFFIFALELSGFSTVLKKVLEAFRNCQTWLPGYIFYSFTKKRTKNKNKPVHLFVAICDHFEPLVGGCSRKIGREKLQRWMKDYPPISSKHVDSEGNHPRHTFFYPIEEYNFDYMQVIKELCRKSTSEVEVHIHHDNDTGACLKETLTNYKNLLYHKHGLLSVNKQNQEISFGFIHGNWALDNSRKDGRWCGVNNELTILSEAGCFGDFTLPSAPSDTQTQKINSIYYAFDDSQRPKSHNWGQDSKAGKQNNDKLLIIQGPLALDWKRRKGIFLPRLENSNISANNPITPRRVNLWINSNIHVSGKPEWIFIKLHTHGCEERNMEALLKGELEFLFSYLEEKYNDKTNYCLHYVSAREMVNIIKALETNSDIEYVGHLRDFKFESNIQRDGR